MACPPVHRDHPLAKAVVYLKYRKSSHGNTIVSGDLPQHKLFHDKVDEASIMHCRPQILFTNDQGG